MILTIAMVGMGAWGPRDALAADDRVTISRDNGRGITLVVRDAEVREVFEMLSRTENISIAFNDQIEGRVSISLFDVEVGEAIAAVAHAAGYGVDRRNGAYMIVEFDDVGQDVANGATEVRGFKIQYSDTDKVREILEKHLSRHGEITALEERRMIVVEDLPEFLDRISMILEEVDRQPRQILLEAKVLEIQLNKDETLGVDWSRITSLNGAEINVGVRGLTSATAPGLFFNLMSDNLEGTIEALTDEGRVRALATPRLLTMENEEAEVLVGSRLGYRVTTTINQVTTESVEFIESGVILRFTPSVDRQGRVLLEIHPEVSTGIIADGVPNQTTTEVTTQLLAENGQRIFIGGLIRDNASEARRGVPLLSKIPWLGLLFARNVWTYQSTETVVIVKPTVQPMGGPLAVDPGMRKLDRYEPILDRHREDVEDNLDQPWRRATDPEPDLGMVGDEDFARPLPPPSRHSDSTNPGSTRPWEIHQSFP
jgi:type II secretory pathway component GspD/PulD (secretin)